MNEFIKPIVMKRNKHDFHAWIIKRKTIRAMKKISPDFSTLCRMAEFIELLRDMYMYSNTSDFHLFTATYPRGYTKANCCSMIYKESGFSITVVLLLETREINIEIARSSQSNKPDKEYIKFIDGEYECKDKYDEEKFSFIIACLMNGVSELIEYYYKNKRF